MTPARACAYCSHSGPEWDVQKTLPRGRWLCKFCRRQAADSTSKTGEPS